MLWTTLSLILSPLLLTLWATKPIDSFIPIRSILINFRRFGEFSVKRDFFYLELWKLSFVISFDKFCSFSADLNPSLNFFYIIYFHFYTFSRAVRSIKTFSVSDILFKISILTPSNFYLTVSPRTLSKILSRTSGFILTELLKYSAKTEVFLQHKVLMK